MVNSIRRFIARVPRRARAMFRGCIGRRLGRRGRSVVYLLRLRPLRRRWPERIGAGPFHSGCSAIAKPQLVYIEAAAAAWIFHQEKSTLKNDREGYINCGFALATRRSFCVWVSGRSRDRLGSRRLRELRFPGGLRCVRRDRTRLTGASGRIPQVVVPDDHHNILRFTLL